MILSIVVPTVVTALFLFLWGWLFAVVVFAKSQAEHFEQISRPANQINVAAIGVEKLVQGLLLTLIYQQLRPWTDLGWLNGLLYGALVGALLEATYFFTFWINLRVPLVPMLTRTLAGWVRMVLAGGLIGWLSAALHS
jgi:hypothetical protein